MHESPLQVGPHSSKRIVGSRTRLHWLIRAGILREIRLTKEALCDVATQAYITLQLGRPLHRDPLKEVFVNGQSNVVAPDAESVAFVGRGYDYE